MVTPSQLSLVQELGAVLIDVWLLYKKLAKEENVSNEKKKQVAPLTILYVVWL